MKIRQAVVLGLVGVALAGCRNDPSTALLERDNNNKELEIYRLKCRVADLEEQLNATPPGPTVITGPGVTEPGAASTRPSAPFESGGRSNPAPLFAPPAGGQESPAGPSLEPLNISPGTETPPGEIPNSLKNPGGSEPGRRIPLPSGSSQWRPTPAQLANSQVQLVSGTAPVDNRAVWQVTLHPSLTGGMGNSAAGDEGILVVVEPRDQAGEIVPLPGNISVALIDPALTGDQARLARWDFTAADTERMLHTGSEPGIHLRLPWRSSPAHDRLEVFVRYTTRDGRILQARRQIAVALGDAPPARPEPPPAIEGPRPDRPLRPQWSPDR